MNNRIQEWFEKMVRGLANQSWLRAMKPNRNTCTYRTTSGMCCAVGHIIPDNAPCIHSNYTAGFLGGAGRLKDLGLGDISEEELKFLLHAQAAHDNQETPEQVKTKFLNLAEQFNLTWPTDISQ